MLFGYFCSNIGKMKKILVCIAVMFSLPLLMRAQFGKYRQFGVKTGLNISNVVAGSSSFTATDVLGTMVGFTYDRVRMRFLTVGTELNFIQKGYGKEMTLVDSLSQPLGTFNNQNKISYVSLPENPRSKSSKVSPKGRTR